MLVLSRYVNETITIGDDVVVTVVAIQGDKVRLGIDAPRVIPVHRGEIRASIQKHCGGNLSLAKEVREKKPDAASSTDDL